MILLTVVVLGTVAMLSIPLELFPSGFTGPFLSIRMRYSGPPGSDPLVSRGGSEARPSGASAPSRNCRPWA